MRSPWRRAGPAHPHDLTRVAYASRRL